MSFIRVRSPDINESSNSETDLEPAFELEVCLDEPGDLEEDQDSDLYPNLLRMVEHEEKQILPHKESLEMVNLGDENEKKEVKIRTCTSTTTRHHLLELLHEFKDVFA